MQRLLLIDDDRELCALMVEFFASHQITVDTEHDGGRGLARALEAPPRHYEMVLLDGMLPVLDGFEVLKQLRRRNNIPVILLTARSAQSDRIAGLEGGADDYISKPFGPEELLARVKAVLRRSARSLTASPELLEIEGIRLDPASRRTQIGTSELDLTTVEFDILDLLMRSAGRVVSRDELSAVLLKRESNPLERSLDVHISNLRKKLGTHRDHIRTIRGSGYQFCLVSQEGNA
jgi:two-component system, OmpR family, response regulator CpxR